MSEFNSNVTSQFRALANVLTLARLGSFRAAMNETSQGFRRLKEDVEAIEAQIGYMIFLRTKVGLEPTPEGQLFIEMAQQVERNIRRIIDPSAIGNISSQGTVTLSVTEGLGIFWVMPRLKEFQERHPNIFVDLKSETHGTDMRKLGPDISIQATQPNMPSMKRTRLCTLHFVLCGAETTHRRLTADQLSGDERLIIDQKRAPMEMNSVARFMDRMKRKPRVSFVDSGFSRYYGIKLGLGIGYLPTYVFIADKTIRMIDEESRYSVDLWICYQEDARSVPRVDWVLKWLQQMFDLNDCPWFRREFIAPREFPEVALPGFKPEFISAPWLTNSDTQETV